MVAKTVSLRRREPLAVLTWSLVGVATVVTLGLADPETSVWLPPCPFHLTTGLHCPTCGTTRALHALLHGNFAAAVSHNVLAVLVLLILGWGWLARLSQRLGPRKLPWPRLRPRIVWPVALAVYVAFGLLRNIPTPPFIWLAP